MPVQRSIKRIWWLRVRLNTKFTASYYGLSSRQHFSSCLHVCSKIKTRLQDRQFLSYYASFFQTGLQDNKIRLCSHLWGRLEKLAQNHQVVLIIKTALYLCRHLDKKLTTTTHFQPVFIKPCLQDQPQQLAVNEFSQKKFGGSPTVLVFQSTFLFLYARLLLSGIKIFLLKKFVVSK